jgi:hypothetical protein
MMSRLYWVGSIWLFMILLEETVNYLWDRNIFGKIENPAKTKRMFNLKSRINQFVKKDS